MKTAEFVLSPCKSKAIVPVIQEANASGKATIQIVAELESGAAKDQG